MASATTNSEGDVTILDYDGTVKEFTSSGGDVPSYASEKESDVLSSDANDYILTRCNGDQWKFPKPEPPADGEEISFCYAATSRPGQSWEVTRDGNGRITKVTDAYDRETLFFYETLVRSHVLPKSASPLLATSASSAPTSATIAKVA